MSPEVPKEVAVAATMTLWVNTITGERLDRDALEVLRHKAHRHVRGELAHLRGRVRGAHRARCRPPQPPERGRAGRRVGQLAAGSQPDAITHQRAAGDLVAFPPRLDAAGTQDQVHVGLARGPRRPSRTDRRRRRPPRPAPRRPDARIPARRRSSPRHECGPVPSRAFRDATRLRAVAIVPSVANTIRSPVQRVGERHEMGRAVRPTPSPPRCRRACFASRARVSATRWSNVRGGSIGSA